jgi:hypothetical protein
MVWVWDLIGNKALLMDDCFKFPKRVTGLGAFFKKTHKSPKAGFLLESVGCGGSKPGLDGCIELGPKFPHGEVYKPAPTRQKSLDLSPHTILKILLFILTGIELDFTSPGHFIIHHDNIDLN